MNAINYKTFISDVARLITDYLQRYIKLVLLLLIYSIKRSLVDSVDGFEKDQKF